MFSLQSGSLPGAEEGAGGSGPLESSPSSALHMFRATLEASLSHLDLVFLSATLRGGVSDLEGSHKIQSLIGYVQLNLWL